MAQATRTTSVPAGLSDNPMENASDWARSNQRPILIAVGTIAVVALLIFGYRYNDRSTNEQAAAALTRAQLTAQQGPASTTTLAALNGVVQKYGKTSSGQQAALLLAQTHYEAGQYAEGVKALEGQVGSATSDFAASFEQMIAMGYEAQAKHDLAAEHFAKAAAASKFAQDKATYQAAQAHALMSAGKLDAAKALWQELSDREDPRFAQEAQVRLGEIAGLASK